MYIAMKCVPMGWVGAVDVMQAVARQLIFQAAGVDPSTELLKDKPLPHGPVYSVICMDGYDHLEVVKRCAGAVLEDGGSQPHQRFVDICAGLGLPFADGKRMIRGLLGPLLGGELDGHLGILMQSRDKTAKFVAKTLALCAHASWPLAAVQHWAGLFCFGASFRRPLFSILQEIFVLGVDEGQGGRASKCETRCS